MTDKRKLSVGIIVDSHFDSHSGIHVRFRIFIDMIPNDQDHMQVTRGLSGHLTLRDTEFLPFIRQLKPHVVLDTEVSSHRLSWYDYVSRVELLSNSQ